MAERGSLPPISNPFTHSAERNYALFLSSGSLQLRIIAIDVEANFASGVIAGAAEKIKSRCTHVDANGKWPSGAHVLTPFCDCVCNLFSRVKSHAKLDYKLPSNKVRALMAGTLFKIEIISPTCENKLKIDQAQLRYKYLLFLIQKICFIVSVNI